MNFDKLNKWLTLLANLGVIAGIFFLAMEVGQNNRLLQAQSSRSMLADRQSMAFMAYQDAEVAELAFKYSKGQPLSDIERFRVENMTRVQLLALQWQFEQFTVGNIDTFPVEGLRVTFQSPSVLAAFGNSRQFYNEDFVKFIDDNILSP